ncbi:MAG: DNA-binding response regulator [Pelagibacteraceae bacterium TMED246]|nr:MAG: DNA-binding response regulator [Pelagibacteraceae bacterium TMED246]|tara:strand:- start:4962 stop:5558 length:597 start_codon:yes stop_codon:yes gene_type:complete
MNKPKVNIIEFDILYNIFSELKSEFNFEIKNFDNKNDFINSTKDKNNLDFSVIILKEQLKKIIENESINSKNIIIFEKLPLKINEILDEININLIKQKYDLQASYTIGNYSVNLNSRTIQKGSKKLSLTEREIEILIFLKKKDTPQKIDNLQKEVWNYSSKLETHTVETHIYRLRKKIKETFNDDDFIKSEKEGYIIQ